MPYLKDHTTTEGPLGFPVTDRQAIALDAILKALPKDDAFRYRKATIARGPSEVLPGERTDVSWISTEDPDRTKEVVIARGMNDSQFKLNPIVTMQHAYYLPPVGKSLWRKVVRDGDLTGIKAKTQYPKRPNDWPAEQQWPADIALSLVQADLLRGKSIGFLPTKVHVPQQKEFEQRGWTTNDVDLVIDEWILLEYACTFLPAQQNAVVEQVAKGFAIPHDFLKAMGIDAAVTEPDALAKRSPQQCKRGDLFANASGSASESVVISRFTPLEEIEKAFERHLSGINLQKLADETAISVLDRLRGRV
jgi:hypothetical protein